MQPQPEVTVLRIGHRPGRDERLTTHVGLTARALGATRVVLPEIASQAAETVSDVTDQFGGPFAVETSMQGAAYLRDWSGAIVHLTMYGEPIQDVEAAIRANHADPLLVVVGAGKVSFDVFARADWNVAVTNQPHSEVAALAVFLDRLFEGQELNRDWVDAAQRIVPEPAGKTVESVE